MATIIQSTPRVRDSVSFFVIGGWVMAAVIVAGFSSAILLGRSSFGAPVLIHLHAVVFFGWLVLYLLQNGLIAARNVGLHRRLGWLAVGWLPAMMVLGTMVTVVNAKHGAPFFFDVNEFLIADPLILYAFGGLTAAAILVRRNTGWHRRLMFCGMAILTGPGIGRLLPLPLLVPWSWWASLVVLLLFPLAGVVADWRRDGRVHPAWWVGMGTIMGVLIAADVIAYSPAGLAFTHMVVDGTPGGERPMRGVAPWDLPRS